MKYIALVLFSLSSLMAKEGPKIAELMAKINKLESIRQEIDEKEKRVDVLNKQTSDLLSVMTYGYDKDQLRLIWKEANRLECSIVDAINHNKSIKEPFCPDLTLHRNELDRMRHTIVRMAAEYFFLQKLYQQYEALFTDIVKIQYELAN